ncbi:hypothetical protein ABW20_dc0105895 [Dactylellina cionopaga]|nr:hypothetical protein ABW20_dc0105895 [Dactylellina cionopaga]
MALYFSQRFTPVYTSPWETVPKYERATTLSHVERIAIGIAPFQEWVMMVRSVYRWEDTAKTARWMVTYLVLWKYQYLITFGYVYLIARVLRSRQKWNQVERVKAGISRARDQQQSVRRVTELIERHGSDGWVEALPDDFGAWTQLKLGDLADVLEIVRNFYEWRSPAQTVYTLVFFGICLLFGIFTDMTYCWRMGTFIFGLWFFISSPVASRWPRYRWLVSPFKWVFWGVPTHADIAYSEFRADAINAINDPAKRKTSARRRARRRKVADYEGPVMVIDDDDAAEDEGYVTNSPDMEEEDGDDDPEELISPHITSHDPESLKGNPFVGEIYCGFRCVHREHPGKLFISDYGLSFETEVRKKVIVEAAWRDLKRIRKKESVSMGKIGKIHALELVLVGEEEITFDAMARRDKAFNRIIGFSGLQWQSFL